MINNLVRKATKPTDDFVAYCFYYNGIFEQMLASVPGVRLYGDAKKSHHPWKKYFNSTSDNVRQLTLDQVPFNDIVFDAVICNNRIKTHTNALNAAMYLNVPLLIVDHIGPDKAYAQMDIEVVKSAYYGHGYVAANKSAQRWNNASLINYFVDIPEFEETRINDYIFCGNFLPQDFLLINDITSDLGSKYRIIGVGADNSKGVDSYEELEEAFLQSKVYIHLPTSNTVTYELLLAMACGCAIVSSHTEAVTNIIKDGENGVLVKDVEDVAPAAKALAGDEKTMGQFRQANFDLLKKDFSRENFVSKWQDTIYTIKRELFVP